MTWSGMQSLFGGEPQGELYTSSRKPCQSPLGPCRGVPSLRPDILRQTHQCRPNGVSRRNTLAFDFLSAEKYCTLVLLCLCMHGGWERSCFVLLRWEQTQLTASFLTVNTAAPLRHGSGTPLHLPPTALLTHRHVTRLPPSLQTLRVWDGNSPVTRSSALPFISSQTYPDYHPILQNSPTSPTYTHIHKHTHSTLYTPLSLLLANTKGSFSR